jgi:hypothetical protein
MAGSDDDIVISPPAARLPGRETAVFNVRWFGIDVGTITARINGIKKIAGRDAYELEATAKTNAFCSAIYRIDDRYVSYMDVERLHTLRHEVYRREGRYSKDAVTDFDQAAHKAYFRNLRDGSTKTIDIPEDVQDALSVGYYFRTVPIEIGSEIRFKVYNNEQVYDLIGVADRKKLVMLPRLGLRAGFHVQPYATLDGRIVKKGRASGYFSCDEIRAPILVSVKAPLFTEVTGTLYEEIRQ